MKRLWQEGTDRGLRMASFVERQLGKPLSQMRVLEIGVGGGGIACVFAQRAKELVAGDCDARTLNSAAQHPQYGVAPFPLVLLDAVSLPFEDSSFDLVLLNGVLEFMGCREGPLTPLQYQRMALREARRVLRPGGTLYLGIENRLYPYYLVRDPHTHQPLVNFLPRKLADRFSLWRDGRPYRHWIYSLRTLRKLVHEAGFETIMAFIPLVSYQLPRCYIPVDASIRESRQALLGRDNVPMTHEFDRVTQITWRGRLWLNLAALLQLQSVMANTFVLLGTTRG